MPRRVVSPGQVAIPFEGVNREPPLSLVVTPLTVETFNKTIETFKNHCDRIATEPPPQTPFFSDTPKKKRAKKKFSPKAPRNFLAAVADARERIESKVPDVWKTANSTTVLGLYGVLHENLYGFLPDDLSDEWLLALKHVQVWLTRHFKDPKGFDDIPRVVAFLRWKFAKEKRLRVENQERDRLIWKWVFNQRTAMDYKAARGVKK